MRGIVSLATALASRPPCGWIQVAVPPNPHHTGVILATLVIQADPGTVDPELQFSDDPCR
jgi:hypothetical protein